MDFKATLSNQLWGPALWKLLHTFSECIGTVRSHPTEERLWIGLLNNLRFTLPCIQCREHYMIYLSSHAFPKINKESVRSWLYDLHGSVNQRLQKENIPYDTLSTVYSLPFSFSTEYECLFYQEQLAIRLHICSQKDVNEMLDILKQLRIFYELM